MMIPMHARKIIGLAGFAAIMAVTSILGAAITLALAAIISLIGLTKITEDHFKRSAASRR